MRFKKAQSILEYTIVLAAIIAAIIFAGVRLIKPAVNQAMSDSADVIEDATSEFKEQFGD